MTFPSPGEWNVPTGGWHIDFPARGAAAATLTLKWLAYLVPVAEQGGGTVVLAGSHRLVERFLRRTDRPSRAAHPPCGTRSSEPTRGYAASGDPDTRMSASIG